MYCVRETEILVEQHAPQGVFVCDHAGRVINKLQGSGLRRPLEVPAFDEAVAALGAEVGALAVVHHDVVLQRRAVVELLVAHVARELALQRRH